MRTLSNADLVESWELSLHDKSPGTRTLYLEIVGYFTEWLQANRRPEGDVGSLVAVTRQDAEAWFLEQRQRGLSPSTVRSRWIALRNLYRWADEEDEIPDNPLARVQVDRPAPPPPDLLTDDEIRAILDACKGTRFVDIRDHAMIRMLLATGLRRAELVALRLGDVDRRHRTVAVAHGKGDRPRIGRFDAVTAKVVDKYIRARSRHRLADQTDRLWLSHMGAVTNKGLNTILRLRAERAGVKGFHPHRLRHSWADRGKTAGISDEDMMMLGGWTDPTVMRRYAAARAADRALAAYDRAKPMEGL